MNTNTVQVLTDFGNKLDGYINILAAKGGVAVEHFWPMFIQQQVINGYVGLGLTGFLLVALVANFWYLRKMHLSHKNSYAHTDVFVGLFILFLILFIGVLIAFSQSGIYIGQITNPEYYAVQELVKLVK